MEAVAYAIRSRGSDLTKEHILEYHLREFSRAVIAAALADDGATVDYTIAALLSIGDIDWANGADLLRQNQELVAKVRAGMEHDGDCTDQCYTCYVCLVATTEKEARFLLPALRRHVLGDAQ